MGARGRHRPALTSRCRWWLRSCRFARLCRLSREEWSGRGRPGRGQLRAGRRRAAPAALEELRPTWEGERATRGGRGRPVARRRRPTPPARVVGARTAPAQCLRCRASRVLLPRRSWRQDERPALRLLPLNRTFPINPERPAINRTGQALTGAQRQPGEPCAWAVEGASGSPARGDGTSPRPGPARGGVEPWRGTSWRWAQPGTGRAEGGRAGGRDELEGRISSRVGRAAGPCTRRRGRPAWPVRRRPGRWASRWRGGC